MKIVKFYFQDFTEYCEGNVFDNETGPNPVRHIAQVICNALFLLWKELEGENNIDRELGELHVRKQERKRN